MVLNKKTVDAINDDLIEITQCFVDCVGGDTKVYTADGKTVCCRLENISRMIKDLEVIKLVVEKHTGLIV